MKLLEVQTILRRKSKSKKSVSVSRFFKTGKGEYAEGDQFLEVSAPELKEFAKKYSDLNKSELKRLLYSVYNEERALSLLIMRNQFHSADPQSQKGIYNFYMQNRKQINNWNLVDASAPGIVGQYLMSKSPSIRRKTLQKLMRSRSLWDRRIAVVSTQTFIRHGQFQETLWLSRELLDDDQDLMHKACGWMLREVGKKKVQVLENFLNREFHKMPRTMLRYAIERLPKDQKKFYMS